jgi:hypothetical protein
MVSKRCSAHAQDCNSRCCDKYGDCPEYSGRPCHHYYERIAHISAATAEHAPDQPKRKLVGVPQPPSKALWVGATLGGVVLVILVIWCLWKLCSKGENQYTFGN